MRRLRFFVPLALLAIAAGCGNSELDHDSAVKVMSSALTATAAADAHVMNGTAAGDLDVTLTNTAGSGSIHVVGSASDEAGTVATSLDITFDHWTDLATNVTLDGALHERGTFTTQAPLTGDVKLSGMLTASGAVSGNVDFDVEGSYGPTGFSVTGDVGGQSLHTVVQISH
jgi:hypothetical protein